MPPHFDEVQSDLRASPEKKWGFVICRCTYGDEAAWERMMSRLNTQAEKKLPRAGGRIRPISAHRLGGAGEHRMGRGQPKIHQVVRRALRLLNTHP